MRTRRTDLDSVTFFLFLLKQSKKGTVSTVKCSVSVREPGVSKGQGTSKAEVAVTFLWSCWKEEMAEKEGAMGS